MAHLERSRFILKESCWPRRDNCAWLRKVYRPLLKAILDRQPVDVGFVLITNPCADLLEDKVSSCR